MKFAGVIKNSFVDYPKNISMVVFTFGCNFNCWYCHNRDIINGEKKEFYDEDEILNIVKNRINFIDGIVITGGEPTISKEYELIDFIKKIKELKLKVKIDTNGTNSKLIKKLLSKNLIDFIAMDIKTSKEKYKSLTCANDKDLCEIEKSIDLILNSNIDYEFRTTFVPDVKIEDIHKIAKRIKNAKSYAIQKYIPQKHGIIKIPHTFEEALEALDVSKKHIKNAFLRSFD